VTNTIKGDLSHVDIAESEQNDDYFNLEEPGE
jgi:hypothetical protein